jgi:hypothetical protein
MAKKNQSGFPSGVDRREFRAFQRRALLALNKDAKAFHVAQTSTGRSLTTQAAQAARLLKVRQKDGKTLLASHVASRSYKELIKRHRPPAHRLRGHNPARYAPYSFPWSYLNSGGAGGAFLYGVDLSTGDLGADLQYYFGGSASAASAMGFWYQAQQTGNLFVNAQLYINGNAEVFCAPGYANANAFVKVFVQQWRPFFSLSAQAAVYNRSEYVFGGDVAHGISGYYSASITVPVFAGGWYALWGALYQHVTVGGIGSAVSNFQGTVGPIVYIEV